MESWLASTMVRVAMGVSQSDHGFRLSCFVFFFLVFDICKCCSLNSEGLTLLQFQSRVDSDPSGAFVNWNPRDCDPCLWSGVECVDGNVVVLNLTGHDLEGVLAPELGNLTLLRFLDLSKNQFSGTVPPQFGQLTMLEVLDLTDNNLSGTVPPELGYLHSLKHLLLCSNNFKGSIPMEIGKLCLLSDVQFDDFFSTATPAGICCINRKVGHSIWQTILKQSKKSDLFQLTIKESITNYVNLLPNCRSIARLMSGSEWPHCHADNNCSNLTVPPEAALSWNMDEDEDSDRRVLLEQSPNLAALPPNNITMPNPSETDVSLPNRSSGSFPAVPSTKQLITALPSTPDKENKAQNINPGVVVSQPNDKELSTYRNSGNSLMIILGTLIAILVLIIAAVILFIFRSKEERNIHPWKCGLSGQLQKAFITGVPKLNRAELETACEDFSNIIYTHDCIATLYKGILSNGVEIAVVSTAITSKKEWSKQAELIFRKKIDSLSQVNHKNFINLIGYCHEDEPFTRLMVFEYAPNGTVFEHIHEEEFDHLDWSKRVRIIMGAAYCLQHMHGLDPPVIHAHLTSKDVYLTDDYAAKISDAYFWVDLIASSKNRVENDSKYHSQQSPLADAETNVHSFGVLMLEIISGKLPYSEKYGDILNWARQYLNDERTFDKLVDPTLESHNDNELYAVCEAIRGCIHPSPRQRPSMTEVIQILRRGVDISPESATPRLSPLWWAELEILSAEAA